MVSERKLHKKIEILKSSIDLEKKTGNEQLNYNTRSPKWADVFRYYLNLKAYDRIKYLLEELESQTVKSTNDGEIEMRFGPNALDYISEYYKKRNIKMSEFWENYFIDYCKSFDNAGSILIGKALPHSEPYQRKFDLSLFSHDIIIEKLNRFNQIENKDLIEFLQKIKRCKNNIK